MTTPIRVAVTGAGGQIGYAFLFRLASGAVFGPEQPVALQLPEITPALPALSGTLMELDIRLSPADQHQGHRQGGSGFRGGRLGDPGRRLAAQGWHEPF